MFVFKNLYLMMLLAETLKVGGPPEDFENFNTPENKFQCLLCVNGV